VTNFANIPGAGSGVPDMGVSLLRLGGALCLVIGMFLAAAWLFRNWQRLGLRPGAPAKLNVLEVKSLGHRQNIFVVGYQQQRLLLASSPAGITLVSHLPAADEEEKTQPAAPIRISFADAFQQVLTRGRS
jgi:flagellar biogenesis protein FliO